MLLMASKFYIKCDVGYKKKTFSPEEYLKLCGVHILLFVENID